MCLRRGGCCREFLGRADIDQLEPAFRGRIERGEAHLDRGILRRQLMNERAARCDALGAARRLDFDAGKIHEIQQQELAVELTRHVQ